MTNVRQLAPAAMLVGAMFIGGAAAKMWTGANIVDGSLTGVDVQDQSLTGQDIADGSIERADLAVPSSGGGPSHLVDYVTDPMPVTVAPQNYSHAVPVDSRSIDVPTAGFHSVLYTSEGTWDASLCTAGTFLSTSVLIDGHGVVGDSVTSPPDNTAVEGVMYLQAGTHDIAVTASLTCGAMGNDWEAEGPITITSRVSVIPR